MSRNNSTTAFQGFSVYQPSLGAVLQWLPAIGTKELDDMVNAFLPGPATIQDKRAHISMDFYAYSRQTGENFRFYPVVNAVNSSPSSTTAPSPASSSTVYDSGYGSSFNVSPVSSMSSWTQNPAMSFSQQPRAAPRSQARSQSSSKRKASVASSESTSFTSDSGMRIMTKDGRDITSLSRGCKTQEQRDHAHLMRLIKACDSCKRKKTRCDPSHKKRPASEASPPHSQASQPEQPQQKPAKKARKTKAVALAPTPPSVESFNAEIPIFNTTPELDFSAGLFSTEDLATPSDDLLWDQFFSFGNEATVSFPDDYDFFHDPAGYLTPSIGSSSSSNSPPQSYPLPTVPGDVIPQDVVIDRSVPGHDRILSGEVSHIQECSLYRTLPGHDRLLSGRSQVLPESPSAEPELPYLNPGGHGTNYVDFNLYSPASDCLDVEPRETKASSPAPGSLPTRSYFHPLGDDPEQRKPDQDANSGEAHGGTAGLLQTTQLRAKSPATATLSEERGLSYQGGSSSAGAPLASGIPDDVQPGELSGTITRPPPLPSIAPPCLPPPCSSSRTCREERDRTAVRIGGREDASGSRTKTPIPPVDKSHEESALSAVAAKAAANEAIRKSSSSTTVLLRHTVMERRKDRSEEQGLQQAASPASSREQLSSAAEIGNQGVLPTVTTTSSCSYSSSHVVATASCRASPSSSRRQLLSSGSNTVRYRLRSPMTTQSLDASVSSGALFSGITAASLLSQTMWNTKTTVGISLWNVLVAGLISCLLVSDAHSHQGPDFRSTVAVLLSLGGLFWLARNSPQLKLAVADSKTPRVSSTQAAQAARVVEPKKTPDTPRALENVRCAARRLSDRAGKLASTWTARLGRS